MFRLFGLGLCGGGSRLGWQDLDSKQDVVAGLILPQCEKQAAEFLQQVEGRIPRRLRSAPASSSSLSMAGPLLGHLDGLMMEAVCAFAQRFALAPPG